MLAYRTPGVYFEPPASRPVLGLPRTDVAGFVGVARRGPLHRPVRLESRNELLARFGGPTPQGYLACAVEGFFANGGQTCWVVRAADPEKALAASVDLADDAGATALRLTASSPGVWGRKLTVTVLRTGRGRFILALRLGDGPQELWRDLSLEPGDPRQAETILNDPGTGSRLVAASLPPGGSGAPPRAQRARLAGGADGLATLRIGHLTGQGSPPDRPWGLAALETVDEVAIVALPDAMPVPRVQPRTKRRPPRCDVLSGGCNDAEEPLTEEPEEPLEFPPVPDELAISEMQRALIAHCEKLRDRVAVLDVPPLDASGASRNPREALAWRRDFNSSYAALYYPWLRVPDPLQLTGLLRDVPPSGYIAGVWARSDRRVGVHKPPANEALEEVEDVLFRVGDVDHGDLNDDGVNVIRPFAGRGIRVAGARTLRSDDPLWRYVNVRRLLLLIAEAIDEGTQWTVFEPHDLRLRREIDRVVRSLLDSLWRRGMLDGATAEEAYSVLCDESTNPPAEVEAGRLVCRIGVQPPWPAEFVVVRLGKTVGGVELIEDPLDREASHA
ncbi:MAG TPA: phage tail sheath subtilisin-like domain-containing protein [Thermoanaerobaculia bacterium]|nr:phage tail sheath subtilisin-like domain-containing protein [Thermoanaerobaculia bacterium]